MSFFNSVFSELWNTVKFYLERENLIAMSELVTKLKFLNCDYFWDDFCLCWVQGMIPATPFGNSSSSTLPEISSRKFVGIIIANLS